MVMEPTHILTVSFEITEKEAIELMKTIVKYPAFVWPPTNQWHTLADVEVEILQK